MVVSQDSNSIPSLGNSALLQTLQQGPVLSTSRRGPRFCCRQRPQQAPMPTPRRPWVTLRKGWDQNATRGGTHMEACQRLFICWASSMWQIILRDSPDLHPQEFSVWLRGAPVPWLETHARATCREWDNMPLIWDNISPRDPGETGRPHQPLIWGPRPLLQLEFLPPAYYHANSRFKAGTSSRIKAFIRLQGSLSVSGVSWEIRH